MYRNKSLITAHIRDHATIYLFMVILFLTGIIFGAIIVNSMSFIQKQDLFFYLEQFFGQMISDQPIGHAALLKESFFYHFRYLLILFLLGLSVIGLPIVWILLFVKGLVVGFSVGFIVNQLGIQGLLLASLSIAPQNLVIIPIYIIAGSLSMVFSLTLLQKLFARGNSPSIFQPFTRYATMFLLLIGISFIAALLETYVASEAMKMVIKSIL